MTDEERKFLMTLAHRQLGLLEARVLEDRRFGPMRWIGSSEQPQDIERQREIEDRERARKRRDDEG